MTRALARKFGKPRTDRVSGDRVRFADVDISFGERQDLLDLCETPIAVGLCGTTAQMERKEATASLFT
jgi:hypothetical protein